MATQRLIVTKIGGQAAQVVAELFQAWQHHVTADRSPSEISSAVDGFAEQLIAHAHCPPILYFAQWIDLWSMGDLVPGLGNDRALVVAGRRFEACFHKPPVAVRTTTINGEEAQETCWLRNHLREAEFAWSELAPEAVIVVLREPLGALVTDEVLVESFRASPPWLAAIHYEPEKRSPYSA
jgi:hypothetical protein